MAKCKTFGTEAACPKKKWVMAGRADKSGKKTQLEIGLFDWHQMQENLPHYPKQKENLNCRKLEQRIN